MHATTRTPESPGALGEVAGDVHIRGLEVTDTAQQRAFRDALEDGAIDVLIHNAGVYGDGMSTAAVHRINAEAPIEMAELLMDAVIRSGQRKIALITSTMGARPRVAPQPRELRRVEGGAQRPGSGHSREAGAGRGCLAVVIHPGGSAPAWAVRVPRFQWKRVRAASPRSWPASMNPDTVVSGPGRGRSTRGRGRSVVVRRPDLTRQTFELA